MLLYKSSPVSQRVAISLSEVEQQSVGNTGEICMYYCFSRERERETTDCCRKSSIVGKPDVEGEISAALPPQSGP